MTVHTIGHSNRSVEELLEAMYAYRIGCLVDVRSFPGSRRYPQFQKHRLQAALATAAVAYQWWGGELGGKRQGDGSRHSALSHSGFRAYAQHMETAAFRAAMAALEVTAASAPTVIMCAERSPQRCHRSLIADDLVYRGHQVRHILEPEHVAEHQPNPRARLEDGLLVYDQGGDDGQMGLPV